MKFSFTEVISRGSNFLAELQCLLHEYATNGRNGYKSPSSNQILAEIILAGANTLYSEIHKLTNSISYKELP
jgi:hypothetical protein